MAWGEAPTPSPIKEGTMFLKIEKNGDERRIVQWKRIGKGNMVPAEHLRVTAKDKEERQKQIREWIESLGAPEAGESL